LVGLPGGSSLTRGDGVKTNRGLQFEPMALLAKAGEGRAASSYAK
jgi:hypothetical protein